MNLAFSHSRLHVIFLDEIGGSMSSSSWRPDKLLLFQLFEIKMLNNLILVLLLNLHPNSVCTLFHLKVISHLMTMNSLMQTDYQYFGTTDITFHFLSNEILVFRMISENPHLSPEHQSVALENQKYFLVFLGCKWHLFPAFSSPKISILGGRRQKSYIKK